MKLIVFDTKPNDPCLPIGIVVPVPLAKVKEALVAMFRSAPELKEHRMMNVKDQLGDFFYYEVASTQGGEFLAKGILMDDHSGGTDVRIDNRQPPHDICNASQKATVVQLTRILFEILVSRGHAPHSDLTQLEQLDLYIDAAVPSHAVGADLLMQLQRITNDMVSGRKREAQAVGEAETLGARAGRGAIEELANALAGSLQAALAEQPNEREKTFRVAELALHAARGADDRSASLTLLAALGKAANAAHEFHRSVAYFKLAADLSQAMSQRETAEAMRKEHAEALRRARGA